MKRVLSKNTVSPSAIAVTIERPSNNQALAEIVVKAPMPTVANTQATRSVPPIVERMALTPTDPSSDIMERARRLVTAHATAEPRAARAPSVVLSITWRTTSRCVVLLWCPLRGLWCPLRGDWTTGSRTPTIIR